MNQPFSAAPVAAARPTGISPLGNFALALVRLAIGWHFLYEGLSKLFYKFDGWGNFFNLKWTAAPFLKNSVGPCAEFFHSLAANPQTLKIVNLANAWGLTIIGLTLMLGLFTRLAAFAGVVLLGLYYAAYLPMPGAAMSGGTEGHVLIINRNLIEALALLAVLVVPAKCLGLDGLLFGGRRRSDEPIPAAAGFPDYSGASAVAAASAPASRRSVLATLVGVPVIGGFVLAYLRRHGWKSFEEQNLDAFSGASNTDRVKELRSGGPVVTVVDPVAIQAKIKNGPMPTGKIKDLTLSRMILGGNLMGGWAHARDLIYVSTLVKAYHNREKIFQTFQIAEACGVNTILTNPSLCGVIGDYWKSTGGKILFISDCGGSQVLKEVQRSIDGGAAACYVQGGIADSLVAKGDFDTIAKCLELTRKNNIPAGIGAHKLSTVVACVEKGLIPDFWMKTLHQTSYWSARPGEKQHDNIWCEEPDATIAFMKERPEPWIAFKILAAGALQPKAGFTYAFQNGADFICVGMYDFQIVDDVNLALDILKNGKLVRQRQWHA